MNVQDKIPEQQLVEIGKSTWKSIQSDDSKDDARSQKKNGGTDQDDTSNG